jgi:hypothetical protein
MEPTVSRLQDEYGDRVDFKKYDSAGSQVEKQKYQYGGQPQFVLVNTSGDIVQTRFGYQTYESLKADLDALLAVQ